MSYVSSVRAAGVKNVRPCVRPSLGRAAARHALRLGPVARAAAHLRGTTGLGRDSQDRSIDPSQDPPTTAAVAVVAPQSTVVGSSGAFRQRPGRALETRSPIPPRDGLPTRGGSSRVRHAAVPTPRATTTRETQSATTTPRRSVAPRSPGTTPRATDPPLRPFRRPPPRPTRNTARSSPPRTARTRATCGTSRATGSESTRRRAARRAAKANMAKMARARPTPPLRAAIARRTSDGGCSAAAPPMRRDVYMTVVTRGAEAT